MIAISLCTRRNRSRSSVGERGCARTGQCGQYRARRVPLFSARRAQELSESRQSLLIDLDFITCFSFRFHNPFVILMHDACAGRSESGEGCKGIGGDAPDAARCR